jgi:hypothetical protein
MVRFLERVPLADIEAELYRIAPRCEPHSLSLAQVIRTLGVAGVARLAGVPRNAVLQAAGPEHCALSDLIETNPYGYIDAPSCGPCGGAYGPSFPLPGGGGRAPGLGRPADAGPGYYPDPGYSVPAGTVIEVQPTFGGGVRPSGTSGTSGTYSGGGGAASASGYVTGSQAGAVRQAGTRSFGTTQLAATYDTRQRRSSGTRRNPGGLTPMQEAAVNAALEAGASSEDLDSLSGDFEAENVTATGPAPISGWPANVPFHKDAWNFSEGWYILQQGDTFSGLAGLYLGSPARFLEIWHLQPYRFTKAIDPSSVTATRPLVRAGERVEMPDEATEKAKELVRTGFAVAPSVGGPGGNPQGKGAPWSTTKKLAVGAAVVGGVAVLGAGAYALT